MPPENVPARSLARSDSCTAAKIHRRAGPVLCRSVPYKGRKNGGFLAPKLGVQRQILRRKADVRSNVRWSGIPVTTERDATAIRRQQPSDKESNVVLPAHGA